MKGKLKDLTRNMDGTWNLTITLGGDCRAAWGKYHDKDVSVEIKQYREKRSLDANAYCWVLLDKLAAQRGISKLDAYREAIRGIGGVSDTICATEKAAPKLVENWSHNGIGWFAETMPSKIAGCTNVILYYGSSAFDTAQMSRLIDMVVQDCITLGIPTKQPEELEELIREWGCE
jgi:hypothetical protein